MRKIKVLLLIIIFIINISFPVYGINQSSCIFVTSEDVIKTMKNNANITSNITEYKNDYISVKVDIPVISGLGNDEVQKSINDKIQSTILSIRDSIEKMAKEDAEMNKKSGYDVRQYVVTSNYMETYKDNNILSLTLIIYQYTGGAHGSTTQLTYNFDLNTGKVGVLKDFFDNNENYRDIILKQIRKEIETEPENYFPETIKNFNGIPYDQSFYLDHDNLVVYFSEYEIAPYAAGIPQFKIPYSVFQNGLKKNINIKKDPISIKTESYIKDEGNFQAYLLYPFIANMENKVIMDKINTRIKEDVFKFNDEIKKTSNENKNEKNEYGEPKNWGASTYFKNYHVNENLMSIVITYSANNGTTENYVLFHKGYNLNLLTGDNYKLKDLFKPGTDYISIINNEIKLQIEDIKKKMGYKNIYKFQSINENTEFYIENGNLIITFPLGEIAAKEYYTPEFTIPFYKISKYVNEGFLEK
ncbi:DUF3298 and DUF4163 domain-containing protein [Clostridium sp.]|uniref:DUF3298 and DUF4163 domain-containing protein n=1 Tax=Clostridium sp. TaxID=1506 RepID=UPI002FC99C64